MKSSTGCGESPGAPTDPRRIGTRSRAPSGSRQCSSNAGISRVRREPTRGPRGADTRRRPATWASSWRGGAISKEPSAPTAAPTGPAMPMARSISECSWRSVAIWRTPRLPTGEPTGEGMRPRPATWECCWPSRAGATMPRRRFGVRRRAETRTARAISRSFSPRGAHHPSRRLVRAPHSPDALRARAPRRRPNVALPGVDTSSSRQERPRRWQPSWLRWAHLALRTPGRLSTPQRRRRPTRPCRFCPRSPRRLLREPIGRLLREPIAITRPLVPTRAGLVMSSSTGDPPRGRW